MFAKPSLLVHGARIALVALLVPLFVAPEIARGAVLYGQTDMSTLGEAANAHDGGGIPLQTLGNGLTGTAKTVSFRLYSSDVVNAVAGHVAVQLFECSDSLYLSCSSSKADGFSPYIVSQTGNSAYVNSTFGTAYTFQELRYYYLNFITDNDIALYGSLKLSAPDKYTGGDAKWSTGSLDANIADVGFRICDTDDCDIIPTPAIGVVGTSTNVALPTITGTTTSAANVDVIIDGNTYTTTPAGTDWSVAVSNPLADGVYTLIASTTSAEGKTGSTTVSYLVDTTVPSVEITDGPADGSATSTALITFFFTATDTNLASVSCAWDGAATSTCALSASSTLAEGTHTFSVVAADAAGNSITVSRSFSVDTTAPVISGTPSDMFVEATAASTTVTYALPTATDAGDGATTTVSCAPASGYGFSLGSTTVACSTSDSSGNTATSSFVVGVRDTTAPVISMTGGDMSLTVGDTFTDPGATATDLGASVTVVATGTVDTAVAGTYTRTYTATDASLNTATTTRTITVSAAPPPPPPPSGGGGGGGNGPPIENPSQGLPQGVVLGTQTQSVQNASPRAVERIEQIQPPANTEAPTISAAVPAKTPVEKPKVAAATTERPAPTVWDVPAPQSNTAAVATAGSGYAIPLWAWMLAGLAALASLAFWRLRK